MSINYKFWQREGYFLSLWEYITWQSLGGTGLSCHCLRHDSHFIHIHMYIYAHVVTIAVFGGSMNLILLGQGHPWQFDKVNKYFNKSWWVSKFVMSLYPIPKNIADKDSPQEDPLHWRRNKNFARYRFLKLPMYTSIQAKIGDINLFFLVSHAPRIWDTAPRVIPLDPKYAKEPWEGSEYTQPVKWATLSMANTVILLLQFNFERPLLCCVLFVESYQTRPAQVKVKIEILIW